MDIKVNNLKKAYEALKEACSNCSLDYIEIYKRGCKLLPKNKKGNKIHIKKENRGKFTKAAKQAGQSVQEYAKNILSNPNATPLQKKRANFARNAKAWSK